MYGDFFLHHTRTRCLQFQIFAHLSSEDIWIFLFPSNCHTQKAENSPQGNFFSTCIIFDICDKYQVWCECWFGLMLSFGIQPRMSKKQNHWISENKITRMENWDIKIDRWSIGLIAAGLFETLLMLRYNNINYLAVK